MIRQITQLTQLSLSGKIRVGHLSRDCYQQNLFFVILVAAFIVFFPGRAAFGVTPAPDGGYPGENTAEGTNALFSLSSGIDNTAIGFDALFADNTGSENTAVGVAALSSNTGANLNTAVGYEALTRNTGNNNTAIGANAMLSNTTGHDNTATGLNALFSNISGISNTANGVAALRANTTGDDNTAVGISALEQNTGGSFNTAMGASALTSNAGGNSNTAVGLNALFFNTAGSNNSAFGVNALLNTTAGNNSATGTFALLNNGAGHDNTAHGFQALNGNTSGSNNIAIGSHAGANLTTGSNNIVIGAGLLGKAGEGNTTRIGKTTQSAAYIGGISGKTVASASAVAVFVDSTGKLGTIKSSARYKDDIKPMDKTSEAILELEPVTFRYKPDLDPDGVTQFGLIAEQVEKINSDLVVRDEDGKVSTVRYEAVNAMLLNEFLKEHRRLQELRATVTKQEQTITQQKKDFEARVARQQEEINALAVSLKDQATTIQKVSAQLQINKTSQLMVNSR